MKEFLDNALPPLFPGLDFLCVPHQGKNDLEKSLKRKLPAWNVPGDVFVILRDNDGGDCLALKRKLRAICDEAEKPALIRIVCQELEAWYFGDTAAMAVAFEDESLSKLGERRKFRDPDHLGSPSQELKTLVPSFQKTSGARKMGQAMGSSGNTSASFRIFLSGLDSLTQRPA